MNLSEFAEKISTLEGRVNRSNTDPQILRFWPLLRVRLLELSPGGARVSNWRKMKRGLGFAFSLLAPANSFQISDVLVFSAQADRSRREGAETPAITQKAMELILDSKTNLTYSHTGTLGFLQILRGEGGASFLRPILLAKIEASIRKALQKKKFPENQYLASQIEEIYGFQISIAPDVLFVETLSKKFERILLRVRPKIVVLSVWYSREAMAMTLACKRLKIKTVDYQHGAQNDIHPMYTNWNLRTQGFDLMPEIFWTWGEISKERINRWAKKYKNHRAIVGGNLSANLWWEKDEPASATVEAWQIKKPVVYVTLQGDAIFNEEILRVLEDTRERITWAFRDHPRLPISTSLRGRIMRSSGKSATIVKNTSLYKDLQNSSVHITGFSTCAFEAEVFGVPTIFTHEIAFAGQKEVLQAKGFFFSFTAEEIAASLDNLLRRNEKPLSNYIDRNVNSKSVMSSLMKEEL